MLQKNQRSLLPDVRSTGSIVLPLALLCLYLSEGRLFGLAIAAVAALVFQLVRPYLRSLAPSFDEITGGDCTYLKIFLGSALALFFELLVIRYQASELSIFGYYKNVSLLACFLGLGIGFARSRGENRLLLVPVFMFLQVVLLHVARWVMKPPGNPSREMVALGMGNVENSADAIYVFSFLGLVFILTAKTCEPLGDFVGHIMSKRTALTSYGVNLLGSLVGIVLFSALSFARTGPAIWLVVGLVPILYFLRNNRNHLLISFTLSGLMVGYQTLDLDARLLGNQKFFTPYQVIVSASPLPEPAFAGVLHVNHDYFQTIYDLSGKHQLSDYAALAKEYYDLPYANKVVDQPEHVLVVGAGSGNDVAAALRGGAKNVDAVEIDPLIVELGRKLHPEQPYSNPGVRVYVTDTRRFMKVTDQKYDLIVYGLLDSHTSSGMSNLRLDSFVYTVEAFREARQRLKKDGRIVLAFSVQVPEIAAKIYRMLSEAFDGKPPIAVATGYDGGLTFVAGDSLPELELAREVTSRVAELADTVEPSTDDWPFLYMPHRTIPSGYWSMLGWLLFLAVILLSDLKSGESKGFFDPEFFFLGAGFMLIETRGLTTLGVTFGSTWLLIPLVVSGILLAGYFGNLLVAKLGSSLNRKALYTVLLVVISAEAFGRISDAVPVEKSFGPWLLLFLVVAPLFFAGILFSLGLHRKPDLSRALSSNLLGAMCGGCLEYLAMYLGFHSLTYLGLLLYGCAFISSMTGGASRSNAPE